MDFCISSKKVDHVLSLKNSMKKQQFEEDPTGDDDIIQSRCSVFRLFESD